MQDNGAEKDSSKRARNKRVKWLVILGGSAATLYAAYTLNKKKQRSGKADTVATKKSHD